MTAASSFTRVPESEYAALERAARKSLVDDAGNPDFAAIRRTPEFLRLRRRLARFVWPAAGFFLAWYLTYVLLAAYAPGLMSRTVLGNVNLGLLLGLSQFVTTVVIMLLYGRYTRRHVDPEVAALRERAGAQRS
jgi:uncharacterized membrane protein (DUF485 family)